MNQNSSAHNLEEILAGYVLGNLDEQEILWLKEQTAANPQLMVQIRKLESALNLMPYGLPENVPNNNLRSQILVQTMAKPVSPKYNWSWIIGAVTTVGALFVGFNNLSLRQQIALTEDRLQQQQELIALLPQPNSRLVALRANDHDVATSGSLLISLESNKAVLTLQNLDPLSGNQVYRLWAVSQGKKIGCSNFKPDPQGKVHLNLSADDALFSANSILVTVEPEEDTEQPLGHEFLSGSHREI